MKSDFSIFSNNSDLVYLDSASTTQIPSQTLGAIINYLSNNRANIHRGLYSLSMKSSDLYEQSLMTISSQIGCNAKNIFQTYNSTYGLNILAELLTKKDYGYCKIFIGQDCHHSAISPFNTRIIDNFSGYIDNKDIWTLELNDKYEYIYNGILSNKKHLIIVPYISNVTGVKHDIKLLKKNYPNSHILLDCSQGGLDVNLDDLGVDFAVFTGHKMYSTHCGIVYIKDIDNYQSNIVGGGTINDVKMTSTDIKTGNEGFTAGSPDVCGLVALASSIKYYNDNKSKITINYEYIYYMLEKHFTIIGNAKNNYGIYTLAIDKDVSYVCMELGMKNICIRGGGLCAYPLFEFIQSKGYGKNLIRLSVGIYTDLNDIEKFINAYMTL